MLLRFLPVLPVIFLCIDAQKVIKLSSLQGGNVRNTVDPSPSFALFASAHSDDSSLLKLIFVQNQDGSVISIDALKRRKQSADIGLLQSFSATSATYITTSLTNAQIATLTGFIYVTTAKQLNANSFFVYDVDQSQVVQMDRNLMGNSTIVFLNSNQQTAPKSSSTLGGWLQSADSSVKLYKGVPSDEEEQMSTQIFSNPVQMIDNKFVLFPAVQKMSVSLETFYMRTSMDVRFTIEPIYYDIDGTGTSNFDATGFYMKSSAELERKVTVLVVRDTRYNGTTGSNIIGALPLADGTVTVQVNDGGSSNSMTVTPVDGILAWLTYSIGKNITISSKHAEGGEYFVQYYVSQDKMISSNEQTTTSPQTTTRSSAGLTVLLSVITALTARFL